MGQCAFWSFFFAVLFTLIRPLIVRYILLPIGERRILASGFQQKNVVKFCESGVRAIFYSISSVLLVQICLESDFFWMPWRAWFVGTPPGAHITWLYYVELGWYLHQTFVHVFLDKRKGDFLVMLIHHLVTVLLISSSWYAGYYRIGILVLFSHDLCDPFLELGKMFNYLHLPYLGLVAFIGLVVSWISLRLLYYPFTLCYSAIFEGVPILGTDIRGFWFFIPLLCSLIPLHYYWFFLIARVGLRVARVVWHWDPEMVKGVDVDAREDKPNKDK